ncbi:DUF6517 family protein [Salinilacihabitans rarus]|uniref:DUF6517 family protein n=1 Tax=Salinilacihabitans rarus TaxID=2961596 RepID=UPI0020C864DC|nr:DUF6517 family protein [Salinilacihabitans rarus]
MNSRRSFLAAGATGALAFSAGCLDAAFGEAPFEFQADPALPTDEALAETGYEEVEVRSESFEETVDVGVEREVHATFWLGLYVKTVEIQGRSVEAASFAAISVPAMELFGSSVNPLDDLDSQELVDAFADDFAGEFGELRDVRHDGTVDVSILGESRSVDRLLAEAEVDGQVVELVLAVAAFGHEDDLIVLVGTYPELLSDETEQVETLMASVEHPAPRD